MKRLLLLCTIIILITSCKKDTDGDKKYTVTYTFNSGSSAAYKSYILNKSDINRPIGTLPGVQSIDVSVSIGDNVRAFMSYDEAPKGPKEISVSYNGKELAYSDTETKIETKWLVNLERVFTASDFK